MQASTCRGDTNLDDVSSAVAAAAAAEATIAAPPTRGASWRTMAALSQNRELT